MIKSVILADYHFAAVLVLKQNNTMHVGDGVNGVIDKKWMLRKSAKINQKKPDSEGLMHIFKYILFNAMFFYSPDGTVGFTVSFIVTPAHVQYWNLAVMTDIL